MANTKTLDFQVIASFDNLEQDIFEISIMANVIKSEYDMLEYMFDTMNTNDLKQLAKFSICQRIENERDILPWLLQTNGKYYFNTNVNNDNETKVNASILKLYLQQFN